MERRAEGVPCLRVQGREDGAEFDARVMVSSVLGYLAQGVDGPHYAQ